MKLDHHNVTEFSILVVINKNKETASKNKLKSLLSFNAFLVSKNLLAILELPIFFQVFNLSYYIQSNKMGCTYKLEIYCIFRSIFQFHSLTFSRVRFKSLNSGNVMSFINSRF